jgi:hypothetical protein
MKNIIAITTYCNTEEKINILIDNINSIRKICKDFEIVIQANFPLPEYVQKMVDFYIYKDLNFLSGKEIILWFNHFIFNKQFNYFIKDYGFSVLSMMKNIASFFYNYDRVLIINYDVIMNPIFIDEFYSNYEYDLLAYSFHPRQDHISLNLMNFNPKKFIDIISNYINYDNYFNTNEIVEQYFFGIVNKSEINYNMISGELVIDKINHSDYNVANKNDFFINEYIFYNDNLLQIYLWNFYQNKRIKILKLNIDGNIFYLQNDNELFEFYLRYDKNIKNATIIEINNETVNIPLKVLDSENAEIKKIE